MRKINFLTVLAALILAGVGTWTTTAHASVRTSPDRSISNDDESPRVPLGGRRWISAWSR